MKRGIAQLARAPFCNSIDLKELLLEKLLYVGVITR
jgi:hypothetical protein